MKERTITGRIPRDPELQNLASSDPTLRRILTGMAHEYRIPNPLDLPRMVVGPALLDKIDLPARILHDPPALVIPTDGCPSCPSCKGYTIADLSAIEHLVKRESWSLDSFVQADTRVEGRRAISKRPLLAMVKAGTRPLDFYGMDRR